MRYGQVEFGRRGMSGLARGRERKILDISKTATAVPGQTREHRSTSSTFPHAEADSELLLIRPTASEDAGGRWYDHAVAEHDASGLVARTRGSTVRHQEHSMASMGHQTAARTSLLNAACWGLV
jgi:hypothetical protein